MRTKRWMATCVVALLSVAAVLAKDIRVVVFKVSQMHCENCEKKVKRREGTFHRTEEQNRVHHLRCRKDRCEEVAGRIQEVQL